MGAWGAGVFDSDASLDLTGTFQDALASGSSVAEATRGVLQEYADELDDPWYAVDVWLPLAALQLAHGSLQPEVRDRALRIIRQGWALDPWEEQGPEVVAERRHAIEPLGDALERGDANAARALLPE